MQHLSAVIAVLADSSLLYKFTNNIIIQKSVGAVDPNSYFLQEFDVEK